MIPAPDGYQYGVRFLDGSVAHYWNGRTQREKAEQYLAKCRELYPSDVFVLVCRRPEGQWQDVAGVTRNRREARLLGPTDEAVRDMAVARTTVRPRNECPHCHPEG